MYIVFFCDIFFFKQKTAYEMRISDWSSDVCSSDLDVPDEVAAAYKGERPKYGPGYIIPSPFDPRLIVEIPLAVAKAAVASGVARKPITDWNAYAHELRARLNPTAGRSEEHTSELQSLMRISYAVFCLKNKTEP